VSEKGLVNYDHKVKNNIEIILCHQKYRKKFILKNIEIIEIILYKII